MNRPPPGTPTSTKKPAAKRRRITADKHSYPSVCGDSEDEKTHEENVQSLKEELRNPSPKSDIIKPLMSKTFRKRRTDILDSSNLVSDICTDYPFFKTAKYVSDM